MEKYKKIGYLHTPFKIFHLIDQDFKTYDFHYHDFHKLLILIKGHVTYCVEGKNYPLAPYDFVLIKAGEVHRPVVVSDSIYERIIIYISPEFEKEYLGETLDLSLCFEKTSIEKTHVFRIPAFEKSKLYIRLQELVRSLTKEDYGARLQEKLCFLQFMILLNQKVLKDHIEYPETATYHEKVSEIMEYIHTHITEELSVQTLSEKFYLNKYYLMHLFKQETGTTLASYISGKRLYLAREQMEQGIPITEACYFCGYKNYSTFLRAYKKFFRETPKHSLDFA